MSTGSAVSNVNMVNITSCQAPILYFCDQCFSFVRVQMTYDIDITIIKQFAILMDMNDAILASWIFNYNILFNHNMLKYYSVML